MEQTTDPTPQAAAITANRDRHIVERVLGGDAETYRLLVDRYAQPMMDYVVAMTGDGAGGGERVRGALAAAFEALSRIPERGNFLPFALRALRRLALAAPTLPLVSEEAIRAPLAAAIRDRQTTPESMSALRSALLRLPSAEREAFILTHMTELEAPDAAYVMAVDPDSVAGHVSEAHRLLEQMAGMPVSPRVRPVVRTGGDR